MSEKDKQNAGGAPKGNNNAAKGRVWSDAVKRALERRTTSKQKVAEIDRIADALLDKCLEGDMIAIKEFGDRLDGKPMQSVTMDAGSNLASILSAMVNVSATISNDDQ